MLDGVIAGTSVITWNSATSPWIIAITERRGDEIIFRSPVYSGATSR